MQFRRLLAGGAPIGFRGRVWVVGSGLGFRNRPWVVCFRKKIVSVSKETETILSIYKIAVDY